MLTSPAAPAVIQARNAVATIFGLNGLLFASWVSRVPQIRDQLDLTPGQLGQVLLVGSAGAVLALPSSGLVINRIGAGRAVGAASVVAGLAVMLIGLGAGPLTSVVAVSAGLFGVGYGLGTCDVAMNVAGATVERRLGRALMPRLHAGFSLGTVLGAGTGALAAAVGLPISVHLGALGVAVIAVALTAYRHFPPADTTELAAGPRPSLRAAWREPRTLLIGVLVLACALSEGIANDWLAVGLVDGFLVSNAVGALGFATFVAAMTVCRVWGAVAIDRWGRVRVLRASAVLVVLGVVLVVFGGSLPVAMVGAVIWGAGAALGFPIGMSAAADDPAPAAVRVSVVSSIGYTAFLAGPPLLGWLGDHLGVHRALLVALGAATVGAIMAGATRRPQ